MALTWRWLLVALLASGCSVTLMPEVEHPRDPEGPERADLEVWAAKPGTAGPQLTRLAARPRRLDPRADEVEISFALGAEAEVRAVIREESGAPVRVLDLGPQPAGRAVITWDGTNAGGRPVPSGVYSFAVEARSPEGGVTIVGPDPEFVPEEVIPQRFTVDRGTRRVSYVLPKPAFVRLRTGLIGNLMVGTLLDWAPQTAGRHEFVWDGMDDSGIMQLDADSRVRLHLDAFRIAPNAIIVETETEPARRRFAHPGTSGYRHALHDPAYCRSIPFAVELPEASRDSELQMPILESGTAPVRVTLAQDLAGYLIDRRFEVLVFVDSTFLFEEEEGVSPINYSLDTTKLSTGPHLLTVNVWTSDDHSGVVTLPFVKR